MFWYFGWLSSSEHKNLLKILNKKICGDGETKFAKTEWFSFPFASHFFDWPLEYGFDRRGGQLRNGRRLDRLLFISTHAFYLQFIIKN